MKKNHDCLAFLDAWDDANASKNDKAVAFIVWLIILAAFFYVCVTFAAVAS